MYIHSVNIILRIFCGSVWHSFAEWTPKIPSAPFWDLLYMTGTWSSLGLGLFISSDDQIELKKIYLKQRVIHLE